MTLVEMLVVLILIGLASATAVWSIGALTNANLDAAAMRFTAAARYAYNRSIARATTVRLVFDLESGMMSFEEAHGRVTLTRVDDPTREEIEEGAKVAVDPWAAAQARLDDVLRPSFGASPFSPLEGERFEAGPLADNVVIERLIVPHAIEPVTEGEGAIYFFPGGLTEHAVIWISDGDAQVYSVELHPLTGRTRVRNYAYEPEVLLDDGRGGTRSEIEN